MKFCKFAACALVITLSTTSLAAKKNLNDEYRDEDDYSSAYYENEGAILFKVRGYGMVSSAAQKSLSGPLSARGQAAPQSTTKSFIENGYGAEAAALMFFGDHIGAEVSGGLSVYNTSNSAV